MTRFIDVDGKPEYNVIIFGQEVCTMRKKRYARNSGSSGRPAAVPAAKPEPSGAMAQLHEAIDRTDFLDSHRKTYVPKPRAVRRYEKFASMGSDQ